MKNYTGKIFSITVIFIIFSISSCTTTRFNTIPAPPSSAKLRVLVMPISIITKRQDMIFGAEKPSGGYLTNSHEFAQDTFNMIGKHLEETGIYTIVSKEDMMASLGTTVIETENDYFWSRDNYAPLRQGGRALHADYAIIFKRNCIGFSTDFHLIMINMTTGGKYAYLDHIALEPNFTYFLKRMYVLYQNMYKKLFADAKNDLLVTAVQRGRLLPDDYRIKPAAIPTAVAKSAPGKQTIEALSASQPLPAIKAPAAAEKQAATKEQISEVPAVIAAKSPVTEIKKEASTPKVMASKVPGIKPALPAAVAKPVSATSPETKKPAEIKTDTKEGPPAAVASSSAPTPAKLREAIAKSAVPDIAKDTATSKVIAKVTPVSPTALPDKKPAMEKQLEKIMLPVKKTADDLSRLVVYDFDTVERFKVVSLILTEALREELFLLGRFTLVNRENLDQVMQEMKLQQSGLVDEKQIVEIGKWLAANEAVTGKFSVFGNNYILQARRTDIKTLGVLGLGSLKCTAGQEHEFLDNMPALARKLSEMKK